MTPCVVCGAPNPSGAPTCYACGRVVQGGSYNASVTPGVLLRLSGIAQFTRIWCTIGGAVGGLLVGAIGGGLLGAVVGSSNVNPASAQPLALAGLICGAAVGSIAGGYVGRWLGDQSVVWLEWSAQVLGTLDAIMRQNFALIGRTAKPAHPGSPPGVVQPTPTRSGPPPQSGGAAPRRSP